MRILITGCGTHSASLVEALRNNPNKEDMYIVGTNCDANKMLVDGVDAAVVNTPINNKSYVKDLLKICKEHGVQIVLPYITAELPIAAEYKAMFNDEGIKVSVSSAKSLEVANDKIKLNAVFSAYMPNQIVESTSHGLYAAAKMLGYYKGKRLCCKISGKCGGTGFAVIDESKCYDISLFNKRGADRYISLSQLCNIADRYLDRIIIQEYIEGNDYSVCVLADNGSTLQICGIEGYAMEFGAIMSGKIVERIDAYEIAKKVVSTLGLDGNCCFDFKIDVDGKPWLLECNPRISASLPFVERAGVHMVYNRCQKLLGRDIDFSLEKPMYGLRMNKYYENRYSI